MQYLVVALVVLALGLCLVGLVLYLAALLAPLMMLFGACATLVNTCRVLVGRGIWQPVLVTPNDVVNGTAGLKQRGPFPLDYAWPGYQVAQWRRDLVALWRCCADFIRHGWSRGFGYGRGSDLRWGAIGLTVLLWTPVTLGAALGGAVMVVLGAVVLGISWAAWGTLIGFERGYDTTVRRLRRAQPSCGVCFHVMTVPAYRCDGCRTVHRDLRPGLLGAVWRRCGCGQRLPTTVLRASRRLEALCQRCDRPLQARSGAVTDIRLPVFGPVSAGKTRLVYAGLVALRDRAAAEGAVMAFDDDTSRQAFEHGAQLIATGGDTAKTPAGQLPPAITARFRRGQSDKDADQALLHLFDAAGEFYANRDDNSELEFLDHAGGLVFVVDPFAVAWVRDQLGGALQDRLAQAHPATGDPDEVYQVTARRLQDFGVDTRRKALAIAVVKADLLTDLPWAADLCAGAVRDWLTTAGLDNLVLQAERDFGEVRYFVVSSVTGVHPGSRMSPAEPFVWLLDRGGFALGRDEQQTREPA
ncbi:hypothetical protein GCM10011581_44770 [Saccharopolyspora subtropica]|uniref:Double-GTPase 2 domain-containing protein n=1 Tax=Saccharopolyspora thermophila TaxID=89367 RepID=A0A917K8A3_9PSEU|nr:hypothetical protein [Saccharopolyspora subtropica]GGJ02750.1 hypothetical protein GCM10011581_44770 [Saccharopolyspora subtropica]